MRLLALAGLMMASTALFACQANNPRQAASIPAPVNAQDNRPAPMVAEPTPSVAQLPPAMFSAPASPDANGPPLNILKPPR